ncbi:hypothetical protein DPMN_093882 [Dreissena polymorpha]|uniref:Uncharacterized protein n=1 Tax=Dreissena polymorpha TaxID=45954 RepID=A0A9D4R1B2_DREPO|nr:hypothetical protein DPMN_093882 [Dreissena polymorpha]
MTQLSSKKVYRTPKTRTKTSLLKASVKSDAEGEPSDRERRSPEQVDRILQRSL